MNENIGCYFCEEIFKKKEIKKYMDKGKTPVCPHCDVDSIVDLPMALDLLHKHYFKELPRTKEKEITLKVIDQEASKGNVYSVTVNTKFNLEEISDIAGPNMLERFVLHGNEIIKKSWTFAIGAKSFEVVPPFPFDFEDKFRDKLR